jgi:hypothetical protein
MAQPISDVLRCLWEATAMIVHQTLDLRLYGFPLELVDLASCASQLSIEFLLALFSLDSLGPIGRASFDQLPPSVFNYTGI